MPRNPFRCLFCLSSAGQFTRREHPIPESLGNDDTFLPPGFVCDPCNQYFGSKLEQRVLNLAPFGPERVFQAVKTKRGKYSSVSHDGWVAQSSGFWDHVYLQSDPPHRYLLPLPDGRILVNPKWATPNDLVRLLLKIGLGLLALADSVNVYSGGFDAARGAPATAGSPANGTLDSRFILTEKIC